MGDIVHDYALDQPGLCFKDAWIAARCAQQVGADEVRLGADPPDFELVLGKQVFHCEAVEVLAPGRRRGDELKADRLKPASERLRPAHVPQEEWLTSDEALAELRRQIHRKAEKGYPASMVLAVYLNLGFVAGAAALHEGMPTALASALAAFSEVWVLNGSNAFQRYYRDLAPSPPIA